MPNRSPKTVGELSEAKVIAALLDTGEIVLLPFGDNQRYDLVLDRGGVFLRVQTKTGRLKNGAIVFATCSSGSTTGHNTRRGYVGEADLFAVYCPETGGVYLVPIEICPTTSLSLRVTPPGQPNGTPPLRASQFEINRSVAQ